MPTRKGPKRAYSGRPPKYEDHEVDKLGKELLAWMDEMDAKGEEVVHLSEWYRKRKDWSKTEWEALYCRDAFVSYYEKAKDWIGERLLKNRDFPQSYGNRFLPIYFTEIRDHERSVVEHKIDHELKKRAEHSLPTEDVEFTLNIIKPKK